MKYIPEQRTEESIWTEERGTNKTEKSAQSKNWGEYLDRRKRNEQDGEKCTVWASI